MRACAVALFALVVLTGCEHKAKDVVWQVRLPMGGVPMATVVHADVHESTCGGPVRASYDVTIAGGAATGMPGTLGPGTYCICAEARDATCRPLASGCVTVTLPTSATIEVPITMLGAPGASPCPATCSNGRCGIDAGTADAGTLDGGGPADMPVADVPAIDLGPADAGTDLGDLGPIDMGPCTGCMNGSTCEVGIAPSACGTGGGPCGTCAGECAAGRCGVAGDIDLTPIATFVNAGMSGGGALVLSAGADTYSQRGTRTPGTAFGVETLSASLPDPLASIGATQFATCGVTTAGALYCWGTNDFGLLARGSLDGSVSTATPTLVAGATDWALVDGGSQHFCAIKNDGTLWCWGDDAHGQLGMSGAARGTPTMVDGSRWLAVSAGDVGTCAIKSDHSLWCWGDDTYGQVGDGRTTTSVPTPAHVGSETDWTLVSVEGTHACGLRGGTLWCWGDHRNGQLGLGGGVTAPVTTPQQVGTDTTWTAVSAGQYHTCALQGGTAYCWGANAFGALGDGTASTQLAPGSALGGAWAQITAGWQWTCGGHTAPTATIFCWGSNTPGGQLGIGMDPTSTPFVRVPTAVVP